MELKDFVASTLGEIQEGVQLAINRAMDRKTNGAINPCWGETSDIGPSHVQNVNFDIAVTVADEEKAGINGGIKVVGISLGGEDSSKSTTSRVSRIQFSIPVIPPVTTIKD
ncbi:hypothetical protein [Shewanella algae]|uniref:hypothetical protein n=1 Tax=Shewanella algae TaxID=38313 RepID=UPI0011854E80|nr:hypothetical protein [Shewanella algae]TVP03203.1 hypothetical protein AYI73_18950 [Shewanella algae]BCV41211.1 hypothetical protein TUM17378_24730 [Shewanella algae]